MKTKYMIFKISCLIIGTSIIISCIDFGNMKFDFNHPSGPDTMTDVRTDAATNITESSAILNGAVNTNNGSVNVGFVYYIGDLSGSPLTVEANPRQVSGNTFIPVSANITGLSAGTTYSYYVSAKDINGQMEFFSTNHASDQIFRGGIKFYVDSTGQHGLIAAPNDQSIGIEWSPGSTALTNATGTSLGTGQANTTAIVATLGAGTYPAKICDDLVLNGYSDWFLPSKDELNLLFNQKTVVGGLNPYGSYWSSTEIENALSWVQYFNTGDQRNANKASLNRVRAIRAF